MDPRVIARPLSRRPLASASALPGAAHVKRKPSSENMDVHPSHHHHPTSQMLSKPTATTTYGAGSLSTRLQSHTNALRTSSGPSSAADMALKSSVEPAKPAPKLRRMLSEPEDPRPTKRSALGPTAGTANRKDIPHSASSASAESRMRRPPASASSIQQRTASSSLQQRHALINNGRVKLGPKPGAVSRPSRPTGVSAVPAASSATAAALVPSSIPVPVHPTSTFTSAQKRSSLPRSQSQSSSSSLRRSLSSSQPDAQPVQHHSPARRRISSSSAPAVPDIGRTSDVSSIGGLPDLQSSPMQVDKEPIRPQKKPTSSSESRLNNLFILHDRDPVILLEYEKEIIDHLRLIEQQTMPSGDYLTRQPQITALMRSQLVEWIVDVHTYLRLLPETLFLTINIMDRYLSSNSVHLHKFQLVAVVSLLIASKVEEIRVPKIQELVFLTDNTYGREEIIKAERYILSRLGYDVGHPGPFTFLRRISVADGLDTKIRTVAKYLMECSLTNEKFLECPASLLAASAMYVAMKVLKNGEWSDAHIHYSGYQESEVVYGGRLLLDTAYNLSTSSPIYRKWADDSLMCASTFLTAYFKHIQFTPFSSA